jgi:class 3 adenylate cyclase
MPDTPKESFYKSVTRQIRRSRKPLTILFTDVEGSTRYWDTHGDVKGRLMIDLINRLIYPVIRRHRGKVVKQIGDAVMASFKSPESALRASIGIQQILERRRKEEKSFRLKVRIGVHTGKALVEHKDVFGDTVNVAARVESYGKGDEICVSGGTASKLSKEAFGLVRKGTFVPKGKRREVTIYKCQWQKYPSLIDDIKEGALLPVVMRQKFEILAYSLAGLGILYFLFLKYFRYLLADMESLALLALNRQLILDIHIAIPIALGVVAIGAVLLLTRIKAIPHFSLSLLRGGFGFAIGFLLFFVPANYLHLDVGFNWNEKLYQSHHLFVKVQEDDTKVHETPSETSPIMRTVDGGNILLLADVAVREGLTWNKVLVGKKTYGWIARIVTAKIGVPEKRLTVADKFYFTYRDLYALIAGVIGFMWGALSFRIRPA